MVSNKYNQMVEEREEKETGERERTPWIGLWLLTNWATFPSLSYVG